MIYESSDVLNPDVLAQMVQQNDEKHEAGHRRLRVDLRELAERVITNEDRVTEIAAQALTEQMSPAEAVQKVAEMRGFTDKFNLPKPETVEANKYFPKMGNPGYRVKMPTKPKGYIPK